MAHQTFMSSQILLQMIQHLTALHPSDLSERK